MIMSIGLNSAWLPRQGLSAFLEGLTTCLIAWILFGYLGNLSNRLNCTTEFQDCPYAIYTYCLSVQGVRQFVFLVGPNHHQFTCLIYMDPRPHNSCIAFFRPTIYLSRNMWKQSWNAKKKCIAKYFASLFSQFAPFFSLFAFHTRVGIRAKS